MKKRFTAILVICLLSTTIFIGCAPKDSSDTSKTEAPKTTSTADNTKTEAPVATGTNSSEKTEAPTGDNSSSVDTSTSNTSLANYAKEQESIIGAQNTDLFSINVTARGNSLVYSYKYDIDLDNATATSSLSGLASVYGSMLSLVKLSVPDCTSIIVEIAGKDGKILASEEYK